MSFGAPRSEFEKLVGKIEATPLGQYKTSKATIFVDWKLGLIHKCLLLVAVIGGTVYMTQQYLAEEATQPSVQFWFEGESAMMAASDYTGFGSSAAPAYCDNPDYDYNYCTTEDGWCETCADGWMRVVDADPSLDGCTTGVDNYWDDASIGCRTFPFGEVARKIGTQGFVLTMAKLTQYDVTTCGSAVNDTCTVPWSTGLRQWNYVRSSPYGSVCTCKTTQDYFVLGAEKLKIVIEHSFGTTANLNAQYDGRGSKKNWRGSSWIEDTVAKAGNKAIVTTAYYDCDPGASWDGEVTFDANCKKHATFKPGTPIAFSIEELLMLAGVTLDEQVADGAVWDDARSAGAPHLMPYRRSVGTNVAVFLTYDGFTDKTDHFRCALEVKVVSESWSSQGSSVVYQAARTILANSVATNYLDQYARGVKIGFIATGLIKVYDPETAVQIAIDTLVIVMTLIPAIMIFLTFNNPFHKAKSAVYKKFNNEQFDINRALGQFGASAVQIASFVRATTGGKDKLTRHDMQALLVELCEGDAALATEIASFILQEANLDGEATMSIKEMVELITADYIDFNALVQIVSKERAAGPGHKVKPEPDQMQQQQQQQLAAAPAQEEGLRMPETASGPRSFAVTVPMGAPPGASFQATAPDGQTVIVTVPPGAAPGATLDLEY